MKDQKNAFTGFLLSYVAPSSIDCAWFVLRFSISGRDGAEIPSGPCFSNEDGMGYVINIPIEHFRLSIASA